MAGFERALAQKALPAGHMMQNLGTDELNLHVRCRLVIFTFFRVNMDYILLITKSYKIGCKLCWNQLESLGIEQL